MFKALLRFLFFLIPATVLRGCAYIIFDNVELVAVDLSWRKLKRRKTKAEEN